ncbi:MAG: hypothetical protein ACWA42_09665 [Lutibacter sp.]
MMILVFKTNIFKELEYHVRSLLETISAIQTVDFDFEDCDRILRIEVSKDLTHKIKQLLNSNGFLVKELE